MQAGAQVKLMNYYAAEPILLASSKRKVRRWTARPSNRRR